MSVTLSGLTVEHTGTPLGVDVRPRFGWLVDPGAPGARQVSWRLRVRAGGAPVWDSGSVSSTESVDVEYAGPALAPLTRYDWSVEVATTAGATVARSWFVTGVLDGDWGGARWIGHASPEGAAPLLRTEFTLEHEPVSALLVVAAGGYARVELNGHPAGPEVLTPGFTDYDETVQYTVSEVAPLLRAGRNAIGAELGRGFYGMSSPNTWGWESAPWHAEPCLRALLLVRHADGSRCVVVSDGTWCAVGGPTRFDDLYAGEKLDARADRPGFAVPGYDAPGWLPATTVTGPRGRLVHQRQQPIGVAEVFEPEQVTELSPGVWVLSFPRVIAGWAEIEADGPAGSVVELRYGEELRADGRPNYDDANGYFAGRFQTDVVTLAGGTLSWESRFTYKGFRYVEVRASTRPRVRAKLAHSLVARTGSFDCSSAALTRLHELTVRTMVNNLHGIPTDTPKYEKNGWTGDGMVGAEMMLLNLDTHELLAKWVDDIAASRHGDGAPEVIAPHGGWRVDLAPSPTWHAALVLVPWWIWWYTGDRRVLQDAWQDMTDYVRFEVARSPGGIATTKLGDWVAPDTDAGGGNPPEDPRICATAFLHAMVVTLGRTARVVGQDPTEWDETARTVRAAFVRAFYDPATATVRGRGDRGYRQAHSTLALAFDLLPRSERPRVADRLAADVHDRGDHLHTGALATKFLLPVLTRYGHGDAAMALAEQTTFPSWGFWLQHGATSLWEHWKPESRSRGHYFLGTIDDWLFHHVAGLEPAGPGWRRVRVAPALTDHLEWARASTRTPYGDLVVHWRHDARGLVVDLTVPVGVTADVELPGLGTERGPGRHRIVAPHAPGPRPRRRRDPRSAAGSDLPEQQPDHAERTAEH